jgi:hypothetical protein
MLCNPDEKQEIGVLESKYSKNLKIYSTIYR